ncbi:MAG TPA: hemerythrin domain-containing protein, partial [Bryobacteraceae bacterium]|nr:hemerythrin domain-containing protein [Bryobacteraceae bacterium]
PRLRPRLLPDELEMVARLDREHREAEALYAELKAAVARLRKDPHNEQLGEEYRNLVKRFTELYNSHIRLEDNELVRVAKRDLTRQELDAISREMKQRRNLF